MCYNCLSILNEIIGQEKTKKLKEILYLIFDFPYKYYTFKHL